MFGVATIAPVRSCITARDLLRGQDLRVARRQDVVGLDLLRRRKRPAWVASVWGGVWGASE